MPCCKHIIADLFLPYIPWIEDLLGSFSRFYLHLVFLYAPPQPHTSTRRQRAFEPSLRAVPSSRAHGNSAAVALLCLGGGGQRAPAGRLAAAVWAELAGIRPRPR